MGDLILDYNDRDAERPLQTDFNYSIGVDWVNKNFRLALYRKRYHLYTQSGWDLGVTVRHIFFRARQNDA
ncbi:hypothetical protein ACFL2V_12020 [Pseudomonadota bacterium]